MFPPFCWNPTYQCTLSTSSIVCWPSVTIHCEPTWIVCLLVLLVGLFFLWSKICVCCNGVHTFFAGSLEGLVVISFALLCPVFRLQPLHEFIGILRTFALGMFFIPDLCFGFPHEKRIANRVGAAFGALEQTDHNASKLASLALQRRQLTCWVFFGKFQNCMQIIGMSGRSIFHAAKSSQMPYTATTQENQ